MYFNTTRRLLQFAFGIQLSLSSANADYFMARVDFNSVQELVSTRAKAAKTYESSLGELNDLAKLDKSTVLDWSVSKSPFRADLHVTLKEFDSSNSDDTTLRPYLETAITKVKFQIHHVEFMKKFLALQLKSDYELIDSSNPLSDDEERALKHFGSSHPHVSLFKIMNNDAKDISGIKTAYKIKTADEQKEEVKTFYINKINEAIQNLKKNISVPGVLQDTVENIKNYFFSQVEEDQKDQVTKIFADLLYEKYRKAYFERQKPIIKRENLFNSDESLMELYIKIVFLKMIPETIPMVHDIPNSPITHGMIIEGDVVGDKLKDIEVDNKKTGDAKNNFSLFNKLIELMDFDDTQTFEGYSYTTSKLTDISHWLIIKRELERLLLNTYITFSGVESRTPSVTTTGTAITVDNDDDDDTE